MDRVARVAIESICMLDAVYPVDSEVPLHKERKAAFAAARAVLQTMVAEFESEEHRIATLYKTDLFVSMNPDKPVELGPCVCAKCDDLESLARDESIRTTLTSMVE